MARQGDTVCKKKRKGASGGRGSSAREGMITDQKRKTSRKELPGGADSSPTFHLRKRFRKRSKVDFTGDSEENCAEKKERIGVQGQKKTPRVSADEGSGRAAGFPACDLQEGNFREAHDANFAKVKGQTSLAHSAGRGQFLEKLRGRLSGGRFRMLNETLYTCSGEEAYKVFQKDPTAFSVYHSGYQDQMARWPIQPVELVIGWLRARNAKLVVADFGCGDARLAKSVKNKVFSLDLVSSDPSVIVGNMAHSPLQTNSIDVVVFCLSLMGTDYPSSVREAARVLRTGGSLVIAEVKSRFESEGGNAVLEQFIACLQSLGFFLVSHDVSNKMFVMLYLHKRSSLKHVPGQSENWPELKACLYKRR